MNYPTTVAGLRQQMRACAQTPTQSVLEHGLQVARYFEDLRRHVIEGAPLQYEWVLPAWVYSHTLWRRLPTKKQMLRYHVYHDCGKPWSRVVDEQGKVHFPEHAKKSAEIWQLLGQDEIEVQLMRMDMEIHLLKDEGVHMFTQHPLASALLLTGLAEIHANAAMFGGVDSISFKMKHKQIQRRGRAITTLLETRENQTTMTKEVKYA